MKFRGQPQKVIQINNAKGIMMRVVKSRTGPLVRLEGFDGRKFLKPEQMAELTETISTELSRLGIANLTVLPAEFLKEFHELKRNVEARRKTQSEYYARRQEELRKARKEHYAVNMGQVRRAVSAYQKLNRIKVNESHQQRRRQRKALRDSAIMFASFERGAGRASMACANLPELLKVNWK